MSSLLYSNNKDPCASVWRRSSAPHAPSTGSCSIRVPRSFPSCCLSNHGIVLSQPSSITLNCVYISAFTARCLLASWSRSCCSGTRAPQDSCKPNRNLVNQPHLDPQAGLSQPCCGPLYTISNRRSFYLSFILVPFAFSLSRSSCVSSASRKTTTTMLSQPVS
jgi:hypothetical protein